MITRDSAVLAFDLAADKQVCALTGPDSQVLARRTMRVKAWELSEAAGWGLAQAARAGFGSVVVAWRADRAPLAGPGPDLRPDRG